MGRKRKKAEILHITGETVTGKPVVGGVYMWCATFGVPLTDVTSLLDKKGHVVDWQDYYINARKEGMGHRTIATRLTEVMTDLHGYPAVELLLKVLPLLKDQYDNMEK